MRRLARHGRRVFGEGLAAPRRRDGGVDDAALELVPHGRHVPQLDHDLGEGLDHVVHVLLGVILAERDDEVALGQRVVESDGSEDVEIFSDLLTQLEPLATAMPFMSQSSNWPSPSMNSVERFRLVEMRFGPGSGPLSLM